MKAVFPLISCICVTRNRPELLQQAIRCFNQQTYPEKELVILYETDDFATSVFLSQPLAEDIRVIPVTPSAGIHLGALRNLAIAHADGAYICQWDDDDWYHPDRLGYQYDLLVEQGYPACVLGHFLLFDSHTSRAYMSGFRSWEGSLLCQKELACRYPYFNLRRGEDSPLIHALQQEGLLYTDRSETCHYLYVCHDENTWDYGHFIYFFETGKALPEPLSSCVAQMLESEVAGNEMILQMEYLFKQVYECSQ